MLTKTGERKNVTRKTEEIRKGYIAIMCMKIDESKTRALVEDFMTIGKRLRMRELPEETQNLYLDMILSISTVIFSITIGMLLVGDRARSYYWKKIPYQERLNEFRRIAQEAKEDEKLRKNLDSFRRTLLEDVPPNVAVESQV